MEYTLSVTVITTLEVCLGLLAIVVSSASGHALPDGGPWPLGAEKSRQYGVVIDAGSSGSRGRVYSWIESADPYTVPDISQTYSYKLKPGISAFANNLAGLETYVESLIKATAENVPESQHDSTVLYFMATAGMRLLLEDRANAVMDAINKILLDDSKNPFSYEPLNTRILSGEEEGAFAWIAVNYLTGFFNDKTENKESAGVLEMGGASLQIAFQPSGSILADKFPVKVGGKNYPLYVHSFLYYGQEYADLWVKQYLYDEGTVKQMIPNPCMLKGDEQITAIHGNNVTYIGTGEPEKCNTILDIYVYDVDPRRCHPKPCSLGPVYQPSISRDMNFYAVGAFLYPLQLLNVLESDGTFSLSKTMGAAIDYCGQDIDTVKNLTGRTDDFLSVECLIGQYIPVLCVKAFKFENDTSQIKAVKHIDDKDTDWALGAIIYESERRGWTCPQQSSASTLKPSSILMSIFICMLWNMHTGFKTTNCTSTDTAVKDGINTKIQ